MKKEILIIIITAYSLFSQNKVITSEQRLKFDDSFFKAMKERTEENYVSEIMYLNMCNEIDSTQYSVYLELGKAYFKIKEYKKAEENYLKANRLEPKNNDILEVITKYYLLMSNKKEMIKWMEELVNIDEKYGEDLLQRYVEVEYYDKALELIYKMKKNKNNLVKMLNVEKDIYYTKGDYERSAQICDELIKLEPKNELHYLSKSFIYTSTNQTEKGLSILVDFAKQNPDKPIINLTLAGFFLKTKNIKESLKYAKSLLHSRDILEDSKMEYLYKLIQENELDDESIIGINLYMVPYMEEYKVRNPKYALLLYTFYKKQERYTEAIDNIKFFISKENNITEDIYLEYLMIITQENDYKFLYSESSKVLDLYPMSPVAHLIKGYAANMLNNRKEALDIFENGLALVYDNKKLESEFYSNIADVYYRDKNYKKSDIYFEKAILLNTSNYLVMNNYSYYLSLRGENLDKAKDFMEIVVNENPDNITYLDTYLWVLYKMGDKKKSLELVEEILNLLNNKSFKEDNSEIREHLGDVYILNELSTQAIEQWEKAIEMGGKKSDINKKIRDAKK